MFQTEGNKEVTFNDYVGPIVRKLNRLIVETARSLSSRTGDVTEADRQRLVSYITSLEKLIDVAAADPIGDYPVSHQHVQYELEPLPEISIPENEIAELIINQAKRMRYEVAHGQTSSLPTSVHQNEHTNDNRRWHEYLKRMRNLIDSYVMSQKPQDQPASMPSKELGEPPAMGVATGFGSNEG